MIHVYYPTERTGRDQFERVATAHAANNVPENPVLIVNPEQEQSCRAYEKYVEKLRAQKRNFVLLTWSPLMIDCFYPPEVFLIDGEDVYPTIKFPDITSRLKYMMLGELLFNESDEYLVAELRGDDNAD